MAAAINATERRAASGPPCGPAPPSPRRVSPYSTGSAKFETFGIEQPAFTQLSRVAAAFSILLVHVFDYRDRLLGGKEEKIGERTYGGPPIEFRWFQES